MLSFSEDYSEVKMFSTIEQRLLFKSNYLNWDVSEEVNTYQPRFPKIFAKTNIAFLEKI